jgi:hypothetical protein
VKKLLLLALLVFVASCDTRNDNNNNPTGPSILPVVQPEVVINLFTAEPGTTVLAGTTVSLRWSSSNALNCRIDPNVGDVPASGFTQLTLVNSATFTLTCVNGIKTASRVLSVVVVAK